MEESPSAYPLGDLTDQGNHLRCGQNGEINHSEAPGCHYSTDDHPDQAE